MKTTGTPSIWSRNAPDDEEWQESTNFGNPDEVIGTPDVLEAIAENHKHLIDQKAMIRARLFDIVLGDWDRHDDQWRWAMSEMDGKKILPPHSPRPRPGLQSLRWFFDQFAPGSEPLYPTASKVHIPN